MIKKIVQIFVPEAANTQIWFYVDMFLPLLLPTIPITKKEILVKVPYQNQSPLSTLSGDKSRSSLTEDENTMHLDNFNSLNNSFIVNNYNHSDFDRPSNKSFGPNVEYFNSTFVNSTAIRHLNLVKRALDDLITHLNENKIDKSTLNLTSSNIDWNKINLFDTSTSSSNSVDENYKDTDTEKTDYEEEQFKSSDEFVSDIFNNLSDPRGNF